MRKKLFGTDGVRGRANGWPMRPDIIQKLGMAASRHFKKGDHRHVVVIGKDTRLSGYMIEPALASGFISMGMNVMLLGPIPTPAVSMLVPSLRADMGVMISASHNPSEDNGIKFFGPDGHKIDEETEGIFEDLVHKETFDDLPSADDLGKAQRLEDASGRYIEFVKNTFPPNLRLDGLKIVVDCAHGAAYRVAPKILWELGADVIPIGINPDGMNINCGHGATKPETLCQRVIQEKAHLGLALDGDADRLIMCDEKGRVIDGDQLLALIAHDWHKTGRLKGHAIVGTVMSNLGLEDYIRQLGLDFIRTPVGDKYISKALRENAMNLGGEQSGHIILNDYARTGDGLVAALQVLAVVARQQKPFSSLCHLYPSAHQVLRNIPLGAIDVSTSVTFQEALKEAETMMKPSGSLVVRKSGTEPVLRLMAQGYDESTIQASLSHLEKAARGTL